MKTYVFLTNSITNMGGAQMLIRNKMLDLESRGWNVQIFYYFPGDDIYITEFEKFSNNRIKELQYPFFTYSYKEREYILNRMVSIINNYGDVVIESDFYELSYWGELLASKVRGINILYFIGEDFPRISSREESFLLFKQNRREFVNDIHIKNKYSKTIAEGHDDNDVLEMPSYNNVYSDKFFPLEYDCSYPVITSIGRLEKNYILPMVKGIIEFAEERDIIVNLFFIGDSEYKVFLDEIKNTLSKTTKVIPYFFGYMYPIPLSLIRATKVAIAVSGSIKVTASQNIPTISMCVEDCQPLGVYGHTTNSRLFRTTEPLTSLSKLLHEILIDGKYHDPIEYKDDDTDKIYHKNAMLINTLLNNDRSYYDCNSMFNGLEQFVYKIKRVVRTILGRSSVLKRVYRFIKKLILRSF